MLIVLGTTSSAADIGLDWLVSMSGMFSPASSGATTTLDGEILRAPYEPHEHLRALHAANEPLRAANQPSEALRC